ncbi:MAG TPA: hypothetical protein VFH17_03090 [Coriobacteriia bacterium]|nr:hypothetical protein [Coriobacteriia bacterium]
MRRTTVTLNGRSYSFDGRGWVGPDCLRPPAAAIVELNRLAAAQFSDDDDQTVGYEQLMDSAVALRDAGQLERALRLARRAMAARPDDAAPAAVTCSVLRAMGRPKEALLVADDLVGQGSAYRPLLTSRAAALADLGLWEDALRQIRQVIAIGGGRAEAEAMSVWGRIKAAAPELFDQ